MHLKYLKMTLSFCIFSLQLYFSFHELASLFSEQLQLQT